MVKIVRWVPSKHAVKALDDKLVSHNESAMWVFDLDQTYRPSSRLIKGKVLLRYKLDQTATINLTTRNHIDFESEEFHGERSHPRHIIVKSNEPGAYGIGRTRQVFTTLHVEKVEYASRREVAKALGIKVNETNILNSHEPPGGWKE